MSKIKHKEIIVIMIILALVAFKLMYKYSTNNKFISKYQNQEYDEDTVKKLFFLNVQEKYIAYYNYGNVLYQLERYEEAKEQYNYALKTVSKKRVCAVRVNLSLTEIMLLPKDGDNDELIKSIKSIQDILLGDECATKDHNGKDEKAQKIYDELENLLNSLDQGQDGGGDDNDGDNDNDDGDDNNNSDGDVIENEQDKIEQIQKNNRDAAGGRSPANERDYNLDNYNQAVW